MLKLYGLFVLLIVSCTYIYISCRYLYISHFDQPAARPRQEVVLELDGIKMPFRFAIILF